MERHSLSAFKPQGILPPGMLDVKCKSHVQRVAAIDCADVEHAPIYARIARVSLVALRQLTDCRNKKHDCLHFSH